MNNDELIGVEYHNLATAIAMFPDDRPLHLKIEAQIVKLICCPVELTPGFLADKTKALFEKDPSLASKFLGKNGRPH